MINRASGTPEPVDPYQALVAAAKALVYAQVLEGERARLTPEEYRTLEQAHLNPHHVFGDHAPPEIVALVVHAITAYDHETTYQDNRARQYRPMSDRAREIMREVRK